MLLGKINRNPAEITSAVGVIKTNSHPFGEKSSYNLRQGVNEFAEEFVRSKKPFGCYVINGTSVYYVNESLLDGDKKVAMKASLQPTSMPGIYFLNEGKLTTAVPKEPRTIVHPAGYEG